MCRAKLSKANTFLPDYKRMALDPKNIEPDEFMRFVESCLKDQKFKDAVLIRILERAFNRLKSDSKYDQFYADEVLEIFTDELAKRTSK